MITQLNLIALLFILGVIIGMLTMKIRKDQKIAKLKETLIKGTELVNEAQTIAKGAIDRNSIEYVLKEDITSVSHEHIYIIPRQLEREFNLWHQKMFANLLNKEYDAFNYEYHLKHKHDWDSHRYNFVDYNVLLHLISRVEMEDKGDE